MQTRAGWLVRHLEEVLACTALALMTLIAFVNVVMRYVFNAPIMWAEEINRYLFIWMTYLGAVVATKHKTHLRLEVADTFLRGRGGALVRLVLHVLAILTLGAVVVYGFVVARTTWATPTALLRVPTGLIYTAAPLCSALMAGYLVRDLAGIVAGLLAASTSGGRKLDA